MVKRDALHQSDARAEERRRCYRTHSVRTFTRLQWHGHQLAVELQVEDLHTVRPPPRLPATLSRNACARSSGRPAGAARTASSRPHSFDGRRTAARREKAVRQRSSKGLFNNMDAGVLPSIRSMPILASKLGVTVISRNSTTRPSWDQCVACLACGVFRSCTDAPPLGGFAKS